MPHPNRGEARPEGAAQNMRPDPPTEVKPPQNPTEVAPRNEERPQRPPASKLEFKVPDLSGIRIPASTPSGAAEESLEKELEKVASIIDLRNKPDK